MMKGNIGHYGFNSVFDILPENFDENITPILSKGDNVVFLWVNRNKLKIEQFYNDANFDPSKHKVYSFIHFEITSLTTNLENLKKSTQMFTVYHRNATTFENLIKTLDSSRQFTYTDIMFYNLFILLIKGFVDHDTFAPLALSNEIYYKHYYDFESGAVYPLPHNFISTSYYHVIFADQTNNNDDALTVRHEYLPNVYFDPKEQMGNVPLTHCSWQANPFTGQVDISPVVILFLNPNSGEASRNSVYYSILFIFIQQSLSDLETAVIDHINRQGGVLGTYIRGYVINTNIPWIALQMRVLLIFLFN